MPSHVAFTVRVSPELYQRLEADRIESGVPTAILIRRAAKAYLDARDAEAGRKTKRARKPSLN